MKKETLPNIEDIEYICKLVFENIKIPVFYLDKNGDIVIEFASSYAPNPLYSSKREAFSQLYHQDDPSDFPILKTTNYLENFLVIRLQKEYIFEGILIVGPSLFSKMPEDILTGLMNDYHFPHRKKSDLFHYYQSLPVISRMKLINAGLLLYYMIYNQKLDMTTVIQKNTLLKNTTIQIEHKVNLNLSNQRQNHFFHHDPKYEKYVWLYIREGRKSELIRHINAGFQGEYGILAKKKPYKTSKKSRHLWGCTCYTSSNGRRTSSGGRLYA